MGGPHANTRLILRVVLKVPCGSWKKILFDGQKGAGGVVRKKINVKTYQNRSKEFLKPELVRRTKDLVFFVLSLVAPKHPRCCELLRRKKGVQED